MTTTTQTTHSPGPCFNHDPFTATLYADLGWGIARGNNMLTSRIEFEKAARLADAAPELLEAAKAALAKLEIALAINHANGQQNGADYATIAKLQRAIAKATGGAL